VKAHDKFFRQLDWALSELGLAGPLQRAHARSAPVELKSRQPLVIIVGVHQQPQSQGIDYFSARYIGSAAIELLEIERHEVEVIIGMKDIAIEFDIAL